MAHGNLMVFSGNANPVLAAQVARFLQIPLGRAEVSSFSDGEVFVEILENVRGRDVFALSALALAIDTLLVCGLVRLLLENQRGVPIGLFLLIGLVAAALVGFSVSAVLRVWRADQREQEGV